MALTPPPAVPQRGDRVTFSNRVDAFLTWMANLVGELNTFLLSLTRLAAGGANSFAYGFDTTTTDSDPGTGRLRFGPGDQNAATIVRIDTTSGDGADIAAVIDAMLGSTSTIKGNLRVQKVRQPSSFVLFDVTGSSAATGYRNLTVTVKASSGANPFALNDDVIVYMERVGDKGEVGVTPVVPYLKVSDRRAQGTAPQALSSSGSKRALNSIDITSISGASLSNDVITLPAGTYEFKARAPATNCGANRITLRNSTAGQTTIVQGANSNSGTGAASIDAVCNGRFTVAVTTGIDVFHYAAVGNAGGSPLSTGPEIYTEIELWKLA